MPQEESRNLAEQPAGGRQPVRPAGRPATIDPDAIAGIALDLFAQRGYEDTSMEDIAKAAGIGRKSLYRYFSSKADLVWGGMEPVVEVSGRVLASDGGEQGEVPDGGRTVDRRGDVLDGLRAAALAGITAIPDLAVTRGRLLLIAEHAELASRSYEAMAPQRQYAMIYLISAGIAADTASYLCAAYMGATFQAWLQWAAGSSPDPAPYLKAAMDVLQVPKR
ncbi:TetR family transcriptional regulator [Arthrobacter sp. M4]|uniref:TetR family transcriptional regulator n=1 Tax=Arthrobacter sp. M4 TaxID=218160 RepID=UPI001CDBBCDD|nr:TetR family transcriptional regulator [Arthrobacter sp. M4]MCA4135252.1 TetR/AcrR family transcriptional regulator [Arthrobacter sp. M4]